ncbi:hypothetical protein [Ferruginibacter sp.]
MKKIAILIYTALIIIMSIVVMSGFVNHPKTASGIHGIISPADAASKVWAVNGKDSVGVAPSSGNFSVDVKPGNWKLHVEAGKGYKDAFVENVVVEEGSYTDAGEIKLVTK